jgi:hypothetical protein
MPNDSFVSLSMSAELKIEAPAPAVRNGRMRDSAPPNW